MAISLGIYPTFSDKPISLSAHKSPSTMPVDNAAESQILDLPGLVNSHILPWKIPFLMGKSTISMAIFNCYVSSPEGKPTNTAAFYVLGLHSDVLIHKPSQLTR